ncbi:MAG: hypothetical protein NT027_18575 [Proteobacteria bacterium]|nr:hypothetical protein [Pseudomonadota bacterium]
MKLYLPYSLLILMILFNSCSQDPELTEPVNPAKKQIVQKDSQNSQKTNSDSSPATATEVPNSTQNPTDLATPTDKAVASPENIPTPPAQSAPVPLENNPSDVKPLPKVKRILSEKCQPIENYSYDDPRFLEKSKVILTRISGACVNASGTEGYLPDSGWMVMGFPCSGGEGRIDWKGTNYNAPKMVSFLLDTNCPMAPLDHKKLSLLVNEEMHFTPERPMSAFNPFMVQYWEFQGLDDADASLTVDIRSNKGLTTIWNQFISAKPLKILLYGRENAWVPGNHLYEVDADIQWVSKNRFTLRVNRAKALKPEDIALVKARCEALRPERDCSKVF